MKIFVVTIAVLLCLTGNGFGGDDSKSTANTVSAAPIQAVAMPRVENTTAASQSTEAPTSDTAQPAISILQPAAIPAAAKKLLNPRLQAIQDAAQPKYADVIDQAERARSSYGFETEDNLNDAELGVPMPVYTVSEQDAVGFGSGQNIDSLLKESGRWMVPVTVNGALRLFIEVSDTTTNGFQPGRPSVIVARVWNKITSHWPAEKNFHPKLVIYPTMPGYYFTVPELPAQNMTDIVAILSELDNKPAALSPAWVTLRSWR